MLDLGGKVAVITGASRGIGAEVARTFAACGAKVVVNYCTGEKAANELVAQIVAGGGEAIAVQADVAVRKDVERLMDQALTAYGTLDILMNNAGVAIDMPWDKMTDAAWERVVAVNMTGTFLCSQIAAQHMVKQGRGKIINVSAATGIRGRKNGLNYCAAKGGVIALTKAFALELAPFVQVNCLLPGFTETEDVIARFHLDDPIARAALLQTIPMQRFAAPSDIAKAALFMASELSDYMTGQLVCVNGGSFM